MTTMNKAVSAGHNFTWCEIREVVPAEYCPIAILVPGWKALEARLGVVFGEYIDPDLGLARGVYFKIGESDFVIESLADAPTDFEYIRILVRGIVDVELSGAKLSDNELTDFLETILVATAITSTELSWVSDSVTFQPYEVWRQDDHGNKFLVEKKPCKADATLRVNELTARGHKQMYWSCAAK